MTNQTANQTEKITITRKERIARDKEMKKKTGKKSKKLAKFALTVALATSAIGIGNNTASAQDCGCTKYAGAHLVQKGDTLYSVAKKAGVTVEQLQAANFKTDTTIYIGQKLLLPAKDQPWRGDAKTPAPTKNTATYTVAKGDTLYAIAKRTGMTVEALKDANDLSTNLIHVGQVLKTKITVQQEKNVRKVNYAAYTVKAGDTKEDLSRKFGNTISIPIAELQAGQKLRIHGDIWVISKADFALADARVIEVVSGDEYYSVNVYEGNEKMQYWAYRTDRKISFAVVQVEDRKELIAYNVHILQ